MKSPSPLVEPDVQISRIGLSQRLSPPACAGLLASAEGITVSIETWRSPAANCSLLPVPYSLLPASRITL